MLEVNAQTITKVTLVNGNTTTDITHLKIGSTYVFAKPFTYTAGSKTGVSSVTCTRASSPYAHATTGTVSNGGTIYYGDTVYFTPSAATGYNVSSSVTSSNPITVTGNITGTNYIIATRKSFIISCTGTNVYFNGTSQTTYETTAYYGDLLVISGTSMLIKKWDDNSVVRETITTSPINSSNAYNYGVVWGDPDSPVTGAQTLACQRTESRKSYTISFATTTYGSWNGGTSKTAYYGDKITRSGNTVTCYKWDATTTARWTNTLNANSNTTQYTYTATASGSNIDSITAAASFGATSTRTTNKYAVNFTLGSYVTSAFTSTNASATSGNASGTTYDYGTTVYYFVVKNADTSSYTYTCDGTHISGNIYRLGSVTVNGTKNLGALSNVTRTSNIITYTIYVAAITSSMIAPYYICSDSNDYEDMVAPGGLGSSVVKEFTVQVQRNKTLTEVYLSQSAIQQKLPGSYVYTGGTITFTADPDHPALFVGVYVYDDDH